MNAEEISALLGRPLTPVETTNFNLYIDIATQALEQLICTSLTAESGDADSRVYDVRRGYSTVFIDVFTQVDEVKLDGEIIPSEDYSVRQWDKRSGDWYNSIVFKRRMRASDEEVEVSASWGFGIIPSDLKMVLANLFAQISVKNKYDPLITEKRVEDFWVKLKTDVDLDSNFARRFGSTLAKYSLCNVPFTRHGKTGTWNQH